MAGPWRACVAAGSNVDPVAHIARGLRRLHRIAPIMASSRFYRTPATGPGGALRPQDPEFCNGMVEVETRLAPLALRRALHAIEAQEGRERGPDRFAPRTLDLDLAVHGGKVMDGDLPHRRYLAVCLLEIHPQFQILPGTPLRDPGGLAMEPLPPDAFGLQASPLQMAGKPAKATV